MQTNIRKPVDIFSTPVIYEVPMFQRAYVWQKDMQWEPLWRDVLHLAEQALSGERDVKRHFLGALVFQSGVPSAGDYFHRFAVIDGQQRLTTLQLLCDAIRRQCAQADLGKLANRLASQVFNDDDLVEAPGDRYKLSPTLKDREEFIDVVGSREDVAVRETAKGKTQLAKAHQFFSEACSDWLHRTETHSIEERGQALTEAVMNLLELVVITLDPQENAQLIFETLNARGEPLSAADLIKNHVFHELENEGLKVDAASYGGYWGFEDTESGFWEKLFPVAGGKRDRISIFFSHWLISVEGTEVRTADVFERFKRHVAADPDLKVSRLMPEINQLASEYKKECEAAEKSLEGDLSPISMFIYRTKEMKIDSPTPVLLALMQARSDGVSEEELQRALDILESWLVRRMLLKASTKNYPSLMARTAKLIKTCKPDEVAHQIENLLRHADGDFVWPGDDAIRSSLSEARVYGRLTQNSVRMILEAIEDHLRGRTAGNSSITETWVKRRTFTIEHIMPQRWLQNWSGDGVVVEERDQRVQKLGNLTLLSRKLNSTVSNGPWLGDDGKAAHIRSSDNLLINHSIANDGDWNVWNDQRIEERTEELLSTILKIWPVPEGHVGTIDDSAKPSTTNILDLIDSERLEPGQILYADQKKFPSGTAIVLSDGSLKVGDKAFKSPSAAAKAMSGRVAESGWNFWYVDEANDTDLSQVRQEFNESHGLDDSDSDHD